MKKKLWILVACICMLVLVGCDKDKDIQETEKTEMTETTDSSEEQESEELENYQTGVEIEYRADLTHDGTEETIVISMEPDEMGNIVGTLVVYNFSDVIFENESYVHHTLWESWFLVKHNEKDYLMRYYYEDTHGVVACNYEVFSFDATGEKVVFDANRIEHSLFDMDTFDKNAWLEFAEKENQYFADAFLLVNTNESNFMFSTSENKITYAENFAWLLKKANAESIEDNLDQFIKEAKEWYARKAARDAEARNEYFHAERSNYQKGDLYITQILNEEMKSDDSRLR